MAQFNPLPDQLQPEASVGTPAPGLLLPPTTPSINIQNPDPTSSMLPMPSESQIQPNQAQQIDEAHHSMVGRLVKAVMGTQTQWQEQIQNTQLRQKKAEETAKMQKYSDEHQHAIAATAGLTIQTAHSLYLIHHMPADNIDHVNSVNQSMAAAAYSAGGKDAQIVVDGKNINGQAANARTLEAALKKNPNLAVAGDSQHVRVPVYTTSMPTTAHVDDTGNWIDKETGKPVDPLDFTTVRLIDQPINSLTQMHTMTKGEVNKAVGSKVYTDGLEESVQLSQTDIMKLADDAQKRAMEQGKLNLEKHQAARQDALAQKSVDIAEKNGQTALATLYKQNVQGIDDAIKERQKADPGADVSDLQGQRSAMNQEFIQAVSNINPTVAKAVGDAQSKQKEQRDLKAKAVRQQQELLQKNLPKAPRSGTPMTKEQKAQFAKSAQSPQEAVSLAISHGFDPYAEPSTLDTLKKGFQKFTDITGPLVGVKPKEEEESTI